MLESVGFQSLVFEDFLEAFTGLIQRVGALEITHGGLVQAFCDPEGQPRIHVMHRWLIQDVEHSVELDRGLPTSSDLGTATT